MQYVRVTPIDNLFLNKMKIKRKIYVNKHVKNHVSVKNNDPAHLIT